MSFEPDLSVLPPEQQTLWPLLAAVPPHFVLYGGTALAVRLGHRRSVDFDFMTHRPLTHEELTSAIPFLAGGETLRSEANTLTVSIAGEQPVAVSFFGGIRFGRVGEPDRAGSGPWIASMLDLAATKMAVVQQRAEAKDYRDVFAILQSGITLEDALGAARALYETQFNAAITLKALAYFGDGDLPSLPGEIQSFLRERATGVGTIPDVSRVSGSLAPGS